MMNQTRFDRLLRLLRIAQERKDLVAVYNLRNRLRHELAR